MVLVAIHSRILLELVQVALLNSIFFPIFEDSQSREVPCFVTRLSSNSFSLPLRFRQSLNCTCSASNELSIDWVRYSTGLITVIFS